MIVRRARRPRAGIALVAALVLMTLIALLIVGAAASSRWAQRASRLGHADALLNAAAEYAINTVLADPQQYQLASLAFGERRTFTIEIAGDRGIRAQASVVRLPNGVLWLSSEAALDGVDEGRRRINVVASFPSLGRDPPASIVARGSIHIGNDVIFAPDTTQAGGCLSTAAPDIVGAMDSEISGAAAFRVAHAAEASDSSTYYLAATQLSALARGADVTRVRGDTTIGGGSFDGVLIVDGVITITGPFTITGLLVAREGIIARAGGLNVTGAMLAFGSAGSATDRVDLQGASIRYSRCAVQRALRLALPPHAVALRGWAELF